MKGKAFLQFAKKAISCIVASNAAPQKTMLQMGLDTLVGDPFACFSYDSQSMAEFVAYLVEEIQNDIPETYEFIEEMRTCLHLRPWSNKQKRLQFY